MQNCFREYPEVYGSELEADDAQDDDDDLTTDPATPSAAHSESTPTAVYSDSTSAPASRSTHSNESSSRPAPQRETGASDKGKLSGERNSKPQSAESAADNRSKLGLVPDNYKPDAKSDEPTSESEQLVPKAAHDAGDANTEVLQRK